MGSGTTASGTNSTAMGEYTQASGWASTAMGSYANASGAGATVMGLYTTSPSLGETVIGAYNTAYTPVGGAGAWNVGDRLFVIGNGISPAARSDALILLKNGNMGVAGTVSAGSFSGDGSGLTGITAVQAGADPAGSAAAVQGNLDTHTGDTANPHAVTAGQAGADPAGSAAAVQGNLDTHAGNVSAHHTRYVDAEATAAVSAEYPALTNAAGTGLENIAYGDGALQSNTTGSSNTASGVGALFNNTTGFGNTAMSNNALSQNVSGDLNTALGAGAGLFNVSGSNNVFLGADAGSNETGSNKLYIASNATRPLIYGEFSATASANKLGIGTSTVAAGEAINVWNGAHLTTGGVWTNGSSRDMKENIRPLEIADAVAAIEALEPMRYNYKVNKGEEYVGFIAEDVPDLVAENGRKGLAAMDIVAVLTQVVKSQKAEIAAMKAENKQLALGQEALATRVEMLTRAMVAAQIAQR